MESCEKHHNLRPKRFAPTSTECDLSLTLKTHTCNTLQLHKKHICKGWYFFGNNSRTAVQCTGCRAPGLATWRTADWNEWECNLFCSYFVVLETWLNSTHIEVATLQTHSLILATSPVGVCCHSQMRWFVTKVKNQVALCRYAQWFTHESNSVSFVMLHNTFITIVIHWRGKCAAHNLSVRVFWSCWIVFCSPSLSSCAHVTTRMMTIGKFSKMLNSLMICICILVT